MWKFSDDERKYVFRILHNGAYDFRSITDDEVNAWVVAGNEPEPPNPPAPLPEVPPSIEQRLQAAETLINLILDEGGVNE